MGSAHHRALVHDDLVARESRDGIEGRHIITAHTANDECLGGVGRGDLNGVFDDIAAGIVLPADDEHVHGIAGSRA